VNATTRTGTAVKSSKNDCLLKSGSSLGVCAVPLKRAYRAIPELINTNTTARRTDSAEVNLSESTLWEAKQHS